MDRLRRLDEFERASCQRPLEWNAPGQLTGLFEDDHPSARPDGVGQMVETQAAPRTPLKRRLRRSILQPLEGSPARTGKARILLGLDQCMRGDDTVVRPTRRTGIHIRTSKLHVLKMEGLRFPLRHDNGGTRTVDPNDTRMRVAAGVKRRENARTAAEIKNGRGTSKRTLDERSDGRVVVVTLAVEDRENSRGGGKVVKRRLLLGSALPLFFDLC